MDSFSSRSSRHYESRCNIFFCDIPEQFPYACLLLKPFSVYNYPQILILPYSEQNVTILHPENGLPIFQCFCPMGKNTEKWHTM